MPTWSTAIARNPAAAAGSEAGAVWHDGPERRALDGWPGVGWFHMTLEVPPAWWGRPVALRFEHLGPAELWVDGEWVYSRGQPSADPASERAELAHGVIPILTVLGPAAEPPGLALATPSAGGPSADAAPSRHLIAIRYSTWFLDRPAWAGKEPSLGLEAGAPAELIRRQSRATRLRAWHQTVLFVTPLAFALPHLMLGLRRRTWGARDRGEGEGDSRDAEESDRHSSFVFFAVGLGASAAGTFHLSESLAGERLKTMVFVIGLVAAAYGVARFTTFFDPRPDERPRLGWLAALSVGVALWALFQPFLALSGSLAVMALAMVVTGRLIVRSPRRPSESWILAAAVPSVIAGLYHSLEGLGWVPTLWSFHTFPTPFYTTLVLMATLSLYLGRDFADTQDDLRVQLAKVRRLSEDALEQERRLRDEAVSRARAEAENERRGAELREAKELQLSLLPARLPELAGLEVAVRMTTATEVGGDYYDFARLGDGSLFLVLGDATGHGLQAGTMVAAAKSLFLATAAGEPEPAALLGNMSSTLRSMGLRRRQMALLALRFPPRGGSEGTAVELASAAMPPVYRVNPGGRVVPHSLPGLPLGAFAGDYSSEQLVLGPGDLLIAFTDGLPEALDRGGEPWGYAAVEAELAELADLPAEDAVTALMERLHRHAAGRELADDVTVLALRKR